MLAANGCVLSRLRSFWTWLSGFQRAACSGILVTVVPEVALGAVLCTVVGMLLSCSACRIWAPMSRDTGDRDEKKLELSTRVLT
jgi:hypothetical protein